MGSTTQLKGKRDGPKQFENLTCSVTNHGKGKPYHVDSDSTRHGGPSVTAVNPALYGRLARVAIIPKSDRHREKEDQDQ